MFGLESFGMADILSVVGAGSFALLFVVTVLSKVWANINQTRSDNNHLNVENSLINNLRTEVERIANDLRETKIVHKNDLETLKKEYDEERDELTRKIFDLESKLDAFQKKHASIKMEAMDAFEYITKNQHLFEEGCFEELKTLLLKIILTYEGI